MSNATAHAPAEATAMPGAIPPRHVPTRRIEFEFPTADLPRHYMGGDVLMSHIVTVLSCMFPEGEDFFVRSVRNYRDRITDPELRRQVAGFIGQESIHGREHRAFNDYLGTLGYPTRFLDRRIKWGLAFSAKTMLKRDRLAMTAALEHYTATLAEVLLTSDRLQESTDIAEVRNIFMWHALEENEHKSVAFDVYQQVSGNERARVWVMKTTTVGFIFSVILGTLVSLAGDPAARNVKRMRASFANLRQSPFLTREVRQMIVDYNRPGFHPDDRDTTELLAEWREKLFGDDGELNDRLKGTTAA